MPKKIPTLTTQADCWGRPDMLAHPWWLTLSVGAGELSREQLADALSMVVARHDGLRAVPGPDANGMWQYILDIEDIEVRVWDVVADDRAWRAVDSEPWPIEKARWVAGIIERPERKLVLKVCHGISDQVGLLIVAADLQQAMRSVRTGIPPTWRPAASLVSLVESEQGPEGRELLRRNNEFVARAFAPGWILKPMPARAVEREYLQTSMVIDQDCMRRFILAAAGIGVSWQILLRAAFLIAEEVVQASGRIRVQSLSHNRDDETHRRCVANLASYVPAMADCRNALLLDPAEWARQLGKMLDESAQHWPISDLSLAEVRLGVEQQFTTEDDVTYRVPHLEIDTSSTAMRQAITVPGEGNRVGPLRTIDYVWRATEVILHRMPDEIQLVIADNSIRYAPGALRLLATCWLGAVESYAGMSATPSMEVFEAARELRSVVGRWPYLDWLDSVLVAVTPSEPVPAVSDQPS